MIQSSEIPKIIHHIWLGQAPLPPEGIACRESWARHHPDWTFKLWTDENLPPLRYQAIFEESQNPAHRADILRYELLCEFGGVYADVDVVCQKSLDPLVSHLYAFAGAHRNPADPSWWTEIAVLGSVPHHPFYEWLLQEFPVWYETHNGQIASHRTGPAFFGTKLSEWKKQWRLLDEDVIIFPPCYFYPYSYPQKAEMRHRVFPNAYTVHLWWGSWGGSE